MLHCFYSPSKSNQLSPLDLIFNSQPQINATNLKSLHHFIHYQTNYQAAHTPLFFRSSSSPLHWLTSLSQFSHPQYAHSLPVRRRIGGHGRHGSRHAGWVQVHQALGSRPVLPDGTERQLHAADGCLLRRILLQGRRSSPQGIELHSTGVVQGRGRGRVTWAAARSSREEGASGGEPGVWDHGCGFAGGC